MVDPSVAHLLLVLNACMLVRCAVCARVSQTLMCGNHLTSFSSFETVLTHELIHAYDTCRAEVDMNNVAHVACTEVRASNLSGDCSFTAQVKLGNFGIRNEHEVRTTRTHAHT